MFRFLLIAMVCVNGLSVMAEENGDEKPLYAQNFEEIELDDYPMDFLVLEGDFSVKEEGESRVLYLPEAPLSSFGALFGPSINENIMIHAEFRSERRGRVGPRFGVGLCGVNGYKLRITPNKRALELYRGEDVVTHKPFRWRSGEWATIHMQIRKTGESSWVVEGKAWQGEEVPDEWTIQYETDEEPINGMPSIWGTPYSEHPIWFDNIVVDEVKS